MRTLMVNALRAGRQRTAMGRYVERLTYWWSRTAIPFDEVVLLAPHPVTDLDLGSVTPVRCVALGSHVPPLLWEQGVLPIAAAGASLLLCPSYTAPVARRGPTAVVNHGIYEALPTEFSLRERLRATPVNRLSALCADRVICNSENTSRDVQRFYGVAAADIDVVLPAAAEVFFERPAVLDVAAEVQRVTGAGVPYALFVGKLARRRNVPNLVSAFAAAVRTADLPHHLLVVGPDTSQCDVPALARAAGVADRVHWRPHLDQPALARLCAGTDAFVLPTTYEGISWTMLEAMAAGAPVITVRHPTLDEGAGPAALVLDEPSVAALTAGLVQVLSSPASQAELRRRSRARAGAFSWRAAAASTMHVLDRTAHPHDDERRPTWLLPTSPATPEPRSSSQVGRPSSAATWSTGWWGSARG